MKRRGALLLRIQLGVYRQACMVSTGGGGEDDGIFIISVGLLTC